MIKSGNDDMDLGLSLGYSNQCVRTRSNNNSGAGVNASSTVDMAFVASDPLSELVWSPQKGLSLKCTDCSLADKKPSLLWDMGPSTMVLSPSQSIRSRGTNDDKPIDQGNLTMSQAAIHVDGEADGTSLARSSRSSAGCVLGTSHRHQTGSGGNMEEVKAEEGNMEEANTVEGVNVVRLNWEVECLGNDEEKGLCSSKNIQIGDIAEGFENNTGQENQRTTEFIALGTNESRPDLVITEALSGKVYKEMMTDHGGRIEDVVSGRQILGLEVTLAEVQTGKQCESLGSPVPNLPFPGRSNKELALVIEEENKNKMKTHGYTSATPLEKLECTGENDLEHLISKDACGQSEERYPRVKSVPPEASPTNSMILLYQRKGKEKALSDEDFNERKSKDEDNSDESVESCNSAGLFSKGKKRWNFEQQLIVGNKRIKKQIQESPASTSLVKQDSSFINWVSNMVKGLAKSNQDEAPSLALTLTHPNHGHDSHDQKIITCNKIDDSGSRSMGFQTIFHSLYCPNRKVQETRMLSEDYPLGGSTKLVLAEKTCGANITPISCPEENNKSFKQFLVSNEKCRQTTSGSGGLLNQPRILSANIAASQEACKTNSAENKTSSNLACSKEKDVVSSSESSLGKRMTNSAEKNNSDPASEGKEIHKIGYRSDPLGSLWISRFTLKSPSPVSNLDDSNHIVRGMLGRSADCTRLIPHAKSLVDFSVDQKSSEARECFAEDPGNAVGEELQNYASSTKASFGFKRIHGQNYQKSIHKVKPILPSQKFTSSEAMASVFVRRLDALRHIMPSNVKDDATRTGTTCFFCGRSGHDLRDCSDVTETELEDLLKNISSYDGTEESSLLCIRCFQPDHWAITCPLASSNRAQQLEHSASLVNHYSADKVQLCTGNKRYANMLEAKESHPLFTGKPMIGNGKKPRMETDLSLNQIWNRKVSSDRGISSLDEVQKHIASSSGENEFKENQITPLCNSVSKQISDVPKGMFDAIKGLRLSRTDILKRMNSHISLLHLDGFFLRLRLGKWEEGLGGTGYYVACITGAQREKSPNNSKNPICVNVGGIKCLVKSQYVSNHDFLEDELMAWWSTTLRSGGKIPSEDDLKLKLEERKELGI